MATLVRCHSVIMLAALPRGLRFRSRPTEGHGVSRLRCVWLWSLTKNASRVVLAQLVGAAGQPDELGERSVWPTGAARQRRDQLLIADRGERALSRLVHGRLRKLQ
jgi:hypothetical protein